MIRFRIKELFCEFEVCHTVTRLVLVLRDSLVAGIRNYNLEAVSFFTHTLQITLKDAYLLRNLQKPLSQLIEINLNHSTLAVRKFEDLQEKLGLQEHKLNQEVPTRWNSIMCWKETYNTKSYCHICCR
ncbi:hypothetical protein J437_LFUL010324 [Ladona fulva]|uniref:Uncharacterized protein n=1 Tax=Ladona fulva TaxID=123851 RepID=A0A8K0KA82_LADFU|nr:hypothetical protein J437_LFUL010324 [Ladona fulva]